MIVIITSNTNTNFSSIALPSAEVTEVHPGRTPAGLRAALRAEKEREREAQRLREAEAAIKVKEEAKRRRRPAAIKVGVWVNELIIMKTIVCRLIWGIWM